MSGLMRWLCLEYRHVVCESRASTHPRLLPITRRPNHIGRAMSENVQSVHVAMKSMSHAERNDLHTGLHYSTRPRTVLTRMVSRLASMFLKVLKRAKPLGSIDLENITINCTEQILNLPGVLPFFPTKITELSRVKDLVFQ